MKRDILALRDVGTVSLVLLAVAACGQSAPTDVARGDHGFIQSAISPAGSKASGTFAPSGPPLSPPVRVDAGGHCIIDLRQGYDISGSMSGSLEIDFRILTYGPCPAGPPVPGTFDEVWIARGTFKGTIVLGDGLTGALRVRGNFADGLLSYAGRVGALE